MAADLGEEAKLDKGGPRKNKELSESVCVERAEEYEVRWQKVEKVLINCPSTSTLLEELPVKVPLDKQADQRKLEVNTVLLPRNELRLRMTGRSSIEDEVNITAVKTYLSQYPSMHKTTSEVGLVEAEDVVEKVSEIKAAFQILSAFPASRSALDPSMVKTFDSVCASLGLGEGEPIKSFSLQKFTKVSESIAKVVAYFKTLVSDQCAAATSLLAVNTKLQQNLDDALNLMKDKSNDKHFSVSDSSPICLLTSTHLAKREWRDQVSKAVKFNELCRAYKQLQVEGSAWSPDVLSGEEAEELMMKRAAAHERWWKGDCPAFPSPPHGPTNDSIGLDPAIIGSMKTNGGLPHVDLMKEFGGMDSAKYTVDKSEKKLSRLQLLEKRTSDLVLLVTHSEGFLSRFSPAKFRTLDMQDWRDFLHKIPHPAKDGRMALDAPMDEVTSMLHHTLMLAKDHHVDPNRLRQLFDHFKVRIQLLDTGMKLGKLLEARGCLDLEDWQDTGRRCPRVFPARDYNLASVFSDMLAEESTPFYNRYAQGSFKSFYTSMKAKMPQSTVKVEISKTGTPPIKVLGARENIVEAFDVVEPRLITSDETYVTVLGNAYKPKNASSLTKLENMHKNLSEMLAKACPRGSPLPSSPPSPSPSKANKTSTANSDPKTIDVTEQTPVMQVILASVDLAAVKKGPSTKEKDVGMSESEALAKAEKYDDAFIEAEHVIDNWPALADMLETVTYRLPEASSKDELQPVIVTKKVSREKLRLMMTGRKDSSVGGRNLTPVKEYFSQFSRLTESLVESGLDEIQNTISSAKEVKAAQQTLALFPNARKVFGKNDILEEFDMVADSLGLGDKETSPMDINNFNKHREKIGNVLSFAGSLLPKQCSTANEILTRNMRYQDIMSASRRLFKRADSVNKKNKVNTADSPTSPMCIFSDSVFLKGWKELVETAVAFRQLCKAKSRYDLQSEWKPEVEGLNKKDSAALLEHLKAAATKWWNPSCPPPDDSQDQSEELIALPPSLLQSMADNDGLPSSTLVEKHVGELVDTEGHLDYMKQMDMFVTKWVNPTANYFAAFEDARLRTFDLEIWRKFLSDEAHPAVSGSALDAGTDDAISGIQHFIKLSKEHYMPSKVIIGITNHFRARYSLLDAESKTKKLLQSLDCKSVNQWGSHCPRLSPDSRFTTKEVLENVWAEAPIPFYVDKNLAANQDTSPEAKKKFVNSLVKPKPSEAKRTDSLIAMRKSLDSIRCK